MDNVVDLMSTITPILDRVPGDFGGGCPVGKAAVLAHLVRHYQLTSFVEIGVYRGRSFLPTAAVVHGLGGHSIGIDPYSTEAALEDDLAPDMAEMVTAFVRSLDFEAVCQSVLELRTDLGLEKSSTLMRATSDEAWRSLRTRGAFIDLLHIDGNHDRAQVARDIDNYLPLMKDGGFLVLDDTDWPSVRDGYLTARRSCHLVYDGGYFAVVRVGSLRARDRRRRDRPRIQNIHFAVERIYGEPEMQRWAGWSPREAGQRDLHRLVSVVVICYNQERFVAECLNSVIAQAGHRPLQLVIGDDCSTDSTGDIVRQYAAALAGSDIDVVLVASDGNVGMTQNLARCLRACAGQYVAFCEGDDFWSDRSKLEVQAAHLDANPQLASVFNDIMMLDERTGRSQPYEEQTRRTKETYSLAELARFYVPGNLAACMFRGSIVRTMPSSLFELYIGDWMLNLYVAQFGDVGHLRNRMTYRRTGVGGLSDGLERPAAALALREDLGEYNRYLDYSVDDELTAHQVMIADQFGPLPSVQSDLLIIDDVFPHVGSPFRFTEFTSYLQQTGWRAAALTSGASVGLLGNDSVARTISKFKRSNPELADRVARIRPAMTAEARLTYFVFLGNAFTYIEQIDRAHIPFVFTLYPGGGFRLNDPSSDAMLRRVTSSPNFRHVVVSQRITREYLLAKKFCDASQVTEVFGLVLPDVATHQQSSFAHFGVDKPTLDIAFVAHKYTPDGRDKGYGTFIESARLVSQKFAHARFHVVGGFDESDLDVGDFVDRITFHGKLEVDALRTLFDQIDVVVSPTVPDRIGNGSFDGFPTGACVEAGLHETVILCTDQLGQNGPFVDGEDIFIIQPDSHEIAQRIFALEAEPEVMRAVASACRQKMLDLYSTATQMAPRLAVIERELRSAESAKSILLDPIYVGAAEGALRARAKRALARVAPAAGRLRSRGKRRG